MIPDPPLTRLQWLAYFTVAAGLIVGLWYLLDWLKG